MEPLMKQISVCLLIIMSFFFLPNRINAQKTKTNVDHYDLSNSSSIDRPLNSPSSKRLSLIKIRGNRFVNAQGDTILFRGAAISDPDKIEQDGKWNKILFVKVKEFGATIVRIPIHPAAWRARTPEKYLMLLDQAVEWCTELGLYIDIDWHSIGNLGMELFQDPMYVTSKQETYEFWRKIALRYSGHNTIAFYEIFNEPTIFSGKLGSMSWSEWKLINEKIIRLIRAYDREKIPLVAGLDWAYDLTPLHIEPIDAEGIGYVTHPYPHKRKPPYVPKWDEDFGFAVGRYPVVATEFGFVLGNQGVEENISYGKEIIQYLEERGMSWMIWVYDPDWHPGFIESWETWKLTKTGEFFHQVLLEKMKK